MEEITDEIFLQCKKSVLDIFEDLVSYNLTTNSQNKIIFDDPDSIRQGIVIV